MTAVCGIDPSSAMGRSGRQYNNTTTMEDNSSITAHTFYQHNSNFEDECRISLSRFTKSVEGRDVRYIKAKAILMDDEVDEAHDLFYLIKMPEEPQLEQQQLECDSSRLGGAGPITPSKLQDASFLQTSIAEKQKRDENQNLMSFGIQGAALQLQPCQNNHNCDSNLTTQHHLNQQLQQPMQETGSFTARNQVMVTSQHQHQQQQTTHNGVLTSNSSQPNLATGQGGLQGCAAEASENQRCETENLARGGDSDSKHEKGNFNKINQMMLLESSQLQFVAERHAMAMASGKRKMPRLPRTYGDLVAKFMVSVRKINTEQPNIAVGQFPISKVPDGKYRIYYFRPKNRNRLLQQIRNEASQSQLNQEASDSQLITQQSNSVKMMKQLKQKFTSSAQDKIQRVGKGQEFYIFDKNSSQSPSKRAQSSRCNNEVSSVPSQSQQNNTNNANNSSSTQLNPAPAAQKHLNDKILGSKRDQIQTKKPFIHHAAPNNQISSKKKQNSKVLDQVVEQIPPSPDEVDRYVVQQALDSHQTTEGGASMSRDSFNTDKIRRENLNQNFGGSVASSSQQQQIGIGAACLSTNSREALLESGYFMPDHQGGVPTTTNLVGSMVSLSGGSGNGLTFAPNSINRLSRGTNNNNAGNTIGSSNATNKQIQQQPASNPLAGLQEIYSVHQYNLGVANAAQYICSQKKSKRQLEEHYQSSGQSYKATNMSGSQHLECPDTPNLYQNVSHISQNTASIEHSSTGDAMQPVFTRASNHQQQPSVSTASDDQSHPPQQQIVENLADIYQKKSSQFQYQASAGSKFQLRLNNTAEQQHLTPTQNTDLYTREEYAYQIYEQSDPVSTIPNEDKTAQPWYKNSGAAIRIEKQTSYSNNSNEESSGNSSSSRADGHHEQQSLSEHAKQKTPQEHCIKVIEPFSASEEEYKVLVTTPQTMLSGQPQLLPPPFDINGDLQGKINLMSQSSSSLESIDVIASPVKIVEGGCLLPSSTSAYHHQDQLARRGPAQQDPAASSQSQQWHHKTILPSSQANKPPLHHQKSSTPKVGDSNGLYEQIGSMEISFLQQLIDTRGPSTIDDMQGVRNGGGLLGPSHQNSTTTTMISIMNQQSQLQCAAAAATSGNHQQDQQQQPSCSGAQMLHSASARHIRAIKAFTPSAPDDLQNPPSSQQQPHHHHRQHHVCNTEIMIEEYDEEDLDLDDRHPIDNIQNRSENFQQQSDDEHGFQSPSKGIIGGGGANLIMPPLVYVHSQHQHRQHQDHLIDVNEQMIQAQQQCIQAQQFLAEGAGGGVIDSSDLRHHHLSRNGSATSSSSQILYAGGSGPQLHSERKQLSTVEEENASQCSDLTSLQQHHSRFMNTQHSSSRKALRRSSMNLNVTGGGHTVHQPGGLVPKSFCISEEPSECEVGEQQIITVELVDGKELLPTVQQIAQNNQQHTISGKLSTASKDGGGSQEAFCPDDATVGQKLPPTTQTQLRKSIQNNTTSENSTKTSSKQPSKAALDQSSAKDSSKQQQLKGLTVINSKGITQMKIEKRYLTKEQMRKSDYYILKTSSPHELDSSETSSSLLELDNNEFNFSSINKVRCNARNKTEQGIAIKEDLPPGASQDTKKPQDYNRKVDLNQAKKCQSPYLVVPSGDQKYITQEEELAQNNSGSVAANVSNNDLQSQLMIGTGQSNFKSKKSTGNGAGIKAQTVSSGDGGNSQEEDASELLESVKLDCSEQFEESYTPKNKLRKNAPEDGELLDLVNKLPNQTEEDGPQERGRNYFSPMQYGSLTARDQQNRTMSHQKDQHMKMISTPAMQNEKKASKMDLLDCGSSDNPDMKTTPCSSQVTVFAVQNLLNNTKSGSTISKITGVSASNTGSNANLAAAASCNNDQNHQGKPIAQVATTARKRAIGIRKMKQGESAGSAKISLTTANMPSNSNPAYAPFGKKLSHQQISQVASQGSLKENFQQLGSQKVHSNLTPQIANSKIQGKVPLMKLNQSVQKQPQSHQKRKITATNNIFASERKLVFQPQQMNSISQQHLQTTNNNLSSTQQVSNQQSARNFISTPAQQASENPISNNAMKLQQNIPQMQSGLTPAQPLLKYREVLKNGGVVSDHPQSSKNSKPSQTKKQNHLHNPPKQPASQTTAKKSSANTAAQQQSKQSKQQHYNQQLATQRNNLSNLLLNHGGPAH